MTTITPPTRVGLVGFGLGGATFHAPFIARTPGLELAAVMTSDTARRSAVEAQYPGTQVVADLDALLALAPRIDLISISSPNASHYPLARAVLESGRHVVVDKPFAGTAAEARELSDIATRAGKLAMPFQNRRWDGDFLTLQRLLRDDTLGRVFRFESRFDRWRPTPKPGWLLADGRARGEDMLHDIATHLVDQALVLFGPVTHVYAELMARHAGVMTHDDAFLALMHAGGVSSHLYMSAMAGQPGPRMSVFGSRAAYMKHGLDVQEEQLKAGLRAGDAGYGEEPESRWGSLVGPGINEVVRTAAGTYELFYAGVARAVREGAAPPVPVADVVAGLEVIEAAYLSHEDRRVVALSS
ncbi:Gfo/Idh/MocA family oxidoreductase [soil metagenome]